MPAVYLSDADKERLENSLANNFRPFTIFMWIYTLFGRTSTSFLGKEKYIDIVCREIWLPNSAPTIPSGSKQIHNMNTFLLWCIFDIDSDEELPPRCPYADFLVLMARSPYRARKVNVFEISAI